jgi:hypothetical protein
VVEAAVLVRVVALAVTRYAALLLLLVVAVAEQVISVNSLVVMAVLVAVLVCLVQPVQVLLEKVITVVQVLVDVANLGKAAVAVQEVLAVTVAAVGRVLAAQLRRLLFRVALCPTRVAAAVQV